MQSLASRLAETAQHRQPWPDAPVPVCLVITDLNVGGAEKALVNLAIGLPKALWKVSVINLGGEEPLAEVLRADGLEVRCLAVSKRKPVQAVRKMARAMQELRPQVVQSFMFHANVAGRLGARLARVPWVIGGLRVAEHQKAWHLTLDRFTARLSLGSVCVSEGVRRFSQTYGGLKSDRLCVIPNGVDVRPFDQAKALDRKELGLPDEASVSLFIGRLDAQKGLPFLLDAAEAVAAQRPDWHLVMMGREGSESEWFHSRVGQSEILRKHVHWLGFRSDVGVLLKMSDVLVLPSLWEGMPNVVLEAMAANRAVIGTDVEGTNELVLPGKTGWIVPPENAPALAEAIGESITNPAQTRRFGASGRARVEAHYTLDRTVEAYDRLWSGVLGLKH